MYTGIFAHKLRGFTLIEILVVVAIIALLASVVLFSTDQARKQSRDRKRMADLKQLQLAIELYAQEHGEYPDRGCGATNNWTGPGDSSTGAYIPCDEYISGLVPTYLERLPTDPNQEDDTNRGYYYYTNGTNYKVIVYGTVESLTVSGNGDEFARYSATCSTKTSPATTYAIYSSGAGCTW